MRSAAFIVLACWLGTGSAAAAGFADYSGPQLYQRFCASCHGVGGFGDGPVAPSLKVMIPDLTELSRRSGGRFPEERIRRVIDGRQAYPAHGTRDMPVWGQELWIEQGADAEAEAVTRRVVDRLVEYLRSMQR